MQIYRIPNLGFIIMSFMFLFPIINFINIVNLNLLYKFYFFSCHCVNSALACCYFCRLLFHNNQDANVDYKLIKKKKRKKKMLTANTVVTLPQIPLVIHDDCLHLI